MADKEFMVCDGMIKATLKLVDNGDGSYSPSISMPIDTTTTGTITEAAGTVVCTLPSGCGTVGLQVTGVWVGQLEFEGSIDGTNYQSVEASNGIATINATAGNDIFILPGAGYDKMRVRASAWTSGEAAITFIASIGTSASILTGSLPAGSNTIGALANNTVSVDVVPTLTVHDAYVANDYVGTSATAMTFAGCARAVAGTGKITSAVLVDYALQSIACELWLFDTAPTPPADSAAWSITDAHAARCIGIVPFTTYYASALNSVSQAHNLGIGFKTAAASTALYGCLVTRGAPAYASGDLTVRLIVSQD